MGTRLLDAYISMSFCYWSLIALQCCVSFYCITHWISHMYTNIPSLSGLLPTFPTSHPSRSSQSTELSSLCYRAGSHQLFVLRMVLYICHDPEIPLLGIYQEKSLIWKDTYTPMLIVALLTTARTWKKPKLKCPSTEQWVKKMCTYIHHLTFWKT